MMGDGLRKKQDEEFEIYEDERHREATPMINDVVAHIQATIESELEDGVQIGQYNERNQQQLEHSDDDIAEDDTQPDEEVILGTGVDEEEDDDNDNEVDRSEAEEDLDDIAYDNAIEIGDASDNEAVDETVLHDMEKLQATFPSFRSQFRLIKRIGEGVFQLRFLPLSCSPY